MARLIDIVPLTTHNSENLSRPVSSFSTVLFAEYRFLGKKGEGTFSEVLKCQNIKDGTYWACKKMKQTYERSET